MKPAPKRFATTPTEPKRPFVVIVNAGPRRGRWGRFDTIEAAAAVAAKLRRHGMAATVETGEEPLA